MKASSSYTTTEQIHSFKCVSCIVMNWENVEHCWLVSVRKFRYNIVVNESDQMEKLPVNNKVGALRSQKSLTMLLLLLGGCGSPDSAPSSSCSMVSSSWLVSLGLYLFFLCFTWSIGERGNSTQTVTST